MKKPKAFPVSASRIETSHLMMPSDANPAGNVFGGAIMRYVDEVAALVAKRHCRKNVVTASIDRISFFHPVHIGDLLILKASLNFVHKTSMEVGVRIEAEDLKTGKRVHTGSAFVTLVALDDKGKPARVPKLILRTEEESHRWKEADMRKKEILEEIRRHKQNKR